MTITVHNHVLCLDYNASVYNPATQANGADCAPVTATVSISNLGSWVLQTYNWVNSGPTPPANLEPGQVWFNQGGQTPTASGYSYATGNTYTRVTCTVTFLNPSNNQSISITPTGDWVVTIGGHLNVSSGPPMNPPLPDTYLTPGYTNDPGKPKPQPNINVYTPFYLEYFGEHNVPDCSTKNPTLPEYAQFPCVGFVSTNQADVATTGYSGVTVQINCTGPVHLYNRSGGPSVACTVVANGPSSSHGDMVPSATFNLDMEDPDHPGVAVTGSCTDCDQHEPYKDVYSFTAHSPSTVIQVASGGVQQGVVNGDPVVFEGFSMLAVDPLATYGESGNDSGGMPNVLVNEQWVLSPPGAINVNLSGKYWTTALNAPTLGDGTFVDILTYWYSVSYPYNSYPNNPAVSGIQTYWAGTEANDGSSGLKMSTWLNQFWTDMIIRAQQ